MNPCENKERVHHQGYGAVGANKDGQKLHIAKEGGKAFAAYGIGYQSHNAKGRQVDDPAHDFGDCFGGIIKHSFRVVTAHGFHGNAEDDCPEEDADVIGLQEGAHRIVDGAHDQVEKHFSNTAGRRCISHFRSGLKGEGGGEEERKGHADNGSQEGACHVQGDDGLHAALLVRLFLGNGVDDKEEDQHRSHAFQGFHEKVAEYLEQRHRLWQGHCQHDAYHQAQGNLVNQLDMGKNGLYLGNQRGPPIYVKRNITVFNYTLIIQGTQ